ncbi:hypothetical protein TELCIR_10707 [Teladorsagia circumcincta]|uniref:Uncharacterized protein n=1 Tax=Teladorsagia circumcincta TaxID=45464 RepID=A0A2G9UBE5_TELCI|nr:hypothetical protein TELCIR_10707 [Teladorsagia circumcincta]
MEDENGEYTNDGAGGKNAEKNMELWRRSSGICSKLPTPYRGIDADKPWYEFSGRLIGPKLATEVVEIGGSGRMWHKVDVKDAYFAVLTHEDY